MEDLIEEVHRARRFSGFAGAWPRCASRQRRITEDDSDNEKPFEFRRRSHSRI